MTGCINGEQFGVFLTRRTEYIDKDILEDWFPAYDPWVGHVRTGTFPTGIGTTARFDRFHMAYPDLTGGRRPITDVSCVGTPCDPLEKKVGYGMDSTDFSPKEESFATDLICWDQNQTILQAKEKWGLFVKNLRKVSALINSNWFKIEAARGASLFHLAGSAGETVTAQFTTGDTIIPMGGKLVTSILTLPFLNKFTEGLQLEGYFQDKFSQIPMFKLITDLNTSQDLKTANPALVNNLQADSFLKLTSEFYKLGVTSSIGNYMISVDHLPLRFNRNAAGDLVRVYPYENVAATVGVKRDVSDQYLNAEVQMSFLWHPAAMKILTMDATAISPDMPFLIRDFAGKWKFAMDNIVIDGQAVDNKRRNKGLWFADFRSATKYERPELVRAILHLTNRPVVVDVPAAQAASPYTAQVTSSANTACTNPTITFTPTVTPGQTYYNMAANTALCNGVPVVHSAMTSNRATLDDVVTSLNSVLSALGTWSHAEGASTIVLTGSSCCSVVLTWS